MKNRGQNRIIITTINSLERNHKWQRQTRDSLAISKKFMKMRNIQFMIKSIKTIITKRMVINFIEMSLMLFMMNRISHIQCSNTETGLKVLTNKEFQQGDLNLK